uniref:Glycosyltransferase 2-like domain-containing protein n=1 Tax=viral metagenome TaxID=1070528 RepID=A0A6C0DLT5_9ZZZZ
MSIPIIIICFNNYKYVQNMIEQINRIQPKYKNDIVIMNNSSDDPSTLKYLKKIRLYYRVIDRDNNGPWISPDRNTDLYNELPDKFILTDPDLELNAKLPTYFIEQMVTLSDKHQIGKLGFAISIEDQDKMYPGNYMLGCSIHDWEYQYWASRINDRNYELYDAPIDTTFSLINKKYWCNWSVRMAGNFTCKHLPFYIENPIMTIEEEYKYYLKSKHSTIYKVFKPYFDEKYIVIDDDESPDKYRIEKRG